MNDNPFKGPGGEDLKKMMGKSSKEPDQNPKTSDDSLVNNKGGGLSEAAKQTLEDRQRDKPPTEPLPETYEFPKNEKAKPDDPATAGTAVLSDAKWPEPDTLFHQEVEVSVKLTTPPGKEHITKAVSINNIYN